MKCCITANIPKDQGRNKRLTMTFICVGTQWSVGFRVNSLPYLPPHPTVGCEAQSILSHAATELGNAAAASLPSGKLHFMAVNGNIRLARNRSLQINVNRGEGAVKHLAFVTWSRYPNQNHLINGNCQLLLTTVLQVWVLIRIYNICPFLQLVELLWDFSRDLGHLFQIGQEEVTSNEYWNEKEKWWVELKCRKIFKFWHFLC